jgi:hypothetical protein
VVELPDVSNWTHQFDAGAAECFVFVLKEGMLSAVAHDLKLRVEEFEVAIDQPTRAVAAIFNAGSLRVISAMKDGQEDPGALTDKNKTEIELNILLEVLKSREYPDIVFVSESVSDSDSGGFIVRGALTIHETTQAITLPVRREGDRYVAEVKVHQPDFGIKPFSAMMGAIRVRPTVIVRLFLPVAG